MFQPFYFDDYQKTGKEDSTSWARGLRRTTNIGISYCPTCRSATSVDNFVDDFTASVGFEGVRGLFHEVGCRSGIRQDENIPPGQTPHNHLTTSHIPPTIPHPPRSRLKCQIVGTESFC